MSNQRATEANVIFEMKRIGAITRITAIDTATGTEAVAQGPANASQADLQRLALSKLRYILNKQTGQ